MDPAASPQRRRGAALENALLEAAWDELTEKGYDAFTIESVAERAQTSRAVVYRRWASKPELVTAAILHVRRNTRIEVPDTGSLREDLRQLLRTVNSGSADLGALLIAQLGSYYAESGQRFADLREAIVAGQPSPMRTVLERAAARGEVDASVADSRLADLPMALMRHELLMTFAPVPDALIDEFIDDIVLPLMLRTRS